MIFSELRGKVNVQLDMVMKFVKHIAAGYLPRTLSLAVLGTRVTPVMEYTAVRICKFFG